MSEGQVGKRTALPAVCSDIYNAEWCEGMGGVGSNELFVQSGGQVIRPRLFYALRLGGVRSGMSVLDIGCGRGEAVIKCAQFGASLPVGLDYAPVSLKAARENIEQIGLRVNLTDMSLALTQADAKALPFDDESFDRIFMLDVIEHLHEWELQHVWGEVRRVLRPEGLLIIHTLPNRWAMDYGYQVARLFVRGLPVTAPDKRDVFHVNEQSVISLYRSLRNGRLRSRIWLADLMLAHADWCQRMQVMGEDVQARVYAVLQHPLWRALYRLATWLPTRLFIATDMFAVAWKSDRAPDDVLERVPRAYVERLTGFLGGWRAYNNVTDSRCPDEPCANLADADIR